MNFQKRQTIHLLCDGLNGNELMGKTPQPF